MATILGGTKTTLLSMPIAVAVDMAGRVYVGDRIDNNVRAYTAAGVWGGVEATGSFNDLAVDSSGNLYIADGMRVLKRNGSGVISTYAGDAYLLAVGDGGEATAAQLFRPAAVALDFAGNLYIADAGTARIRKVSGAGIIGTIAGNGVAAFAGDGGWRLRRRWTIRWGWRWMLREICW